MENPVDGTINVQPAEQLANIVPFAASRDDTAVVNEVVPNGHEADVPEAGGHQYDDDDDDDENCEEDDAVDDQILEDAIEEGMPMLFATRPSSASASATTSTPMQTITQDPNALTTGSVNHFDRLSAELNNNIIQLTLVSDKPILVTSQATAPKIPALLRVSKQFRDIGGSIYYGANAFQFDTRYSHPRGSHFDQNSPPVNELAIAHDWVEHQDPELLRHVRNVLVLFDLPCDLSGQSCRFSTRYRAAIDFARSDDACAVETRRCTRGSHWPRIDPDSEHCKSVICERELRSLQHSIGLIWRVLRGQPEAAGSLMKEKLHKLLKALARPRRGKWSW